MNDNIPVLKSKDDKLIHDKAMERLDHVIRQGTQPGKLKVTINPYQGNYYHVTPDRPAHFIHGVIPEHFFAVQIAL